jgi:hypothetical protein
MPDDAYERAGLLSTLGRAQALLWAYSGEIEHLKASEDSQRLAVALTSSIDPWSTNRRLHLAMSRIALAEEGGTAQERIEVGQAVTSLSRHAATTMPGDDRLMATVMRAAWQVSGGEELLDEAIRRGLDMIGSDGTVAAAEDLADVGDLLFQRWMRSGYPLDLTACVELLTTAVNHSQWFGGARPPRVVNLLARALRAIWETTADSVALRESIRLLETVVDAESTPATERPMFLNNLGTMRMRLSETAGDSRDLAIGLQNLRAACAAADSVDLGLPMYLHNLANALAMTWLVGSDVAALDEAVLLARQAVERTPEDHPDRLLHVANLSGLLVQSWHAGRGNLAQLAEAVNMLRRVLDVLDSAPAVAAFAVLLHLGEATLSLGQLVQDPELIGEGRSLLATAVQSAGGSPHHRVQAASRLGAVEAESGRFREASSAYRTAVDLLSRLPGDRMHRAEQEHALGRYPGLASEAASILLQDSSGLDALSTMEQGRGVLHGRTLSTQTQLEQLRAQRPDLAGRLEDLRRQMGAQQTNEFLAPPAATAADLLARTSRVG